jgi:hypothetical protein
MASAESNSSERREITPSNRLVAQISTTRRDLSSDPRGCTGLSVARWMRKVLEEVRGRQYQITLVGHRAPVVRRAAAVVVHGPRRSESPFLEKGCGGNDAGGGR